MKRLNEYISTAEGVRQMWNDINEIMDTFDFSKVLGAMEALEWEWHCPENEIEEKEEMGRVVHYNPEYPILSTYKPEIDDIRIRARKLLEEVVEHAAKYDTPENRTSEEPLDYHLETGGFAATLTILDDKGRIEAYGEDAPDDWEHSVGLRLMFVIEDTMFKWE